jgi:hypothetical protein
MIGIDFSHYAPPALTARQPFTRNVLFGWSTRPWESVPAPERAGRPRGGTPGGTGLGFAVPHDTPGLFDAALEIEESGYGAAAPDHFSAVESGNQSRYDPLRTDSGIPSSAFQLGHGEERRRREISSTCSFCHVHYLRTRAHFLG